MSLWKSQRSFEIDTLVQAPVERVRALFADPQRWIRLHPLIQEIIEEAGNPGFFQIREVVRFAGIPIDNRYRARIAPHDAGVDSEAWSSPAIHVDNRLRWFAEGSATRIREACSIEAPAPLADYVTRTARRAHEEQLDRVRDTLDTAARA